MIQKITPAPTDTARILVADDEDTFRLSTAALLEQEGFLCSMAVDAHQAKAQLSAEDFSLVVADIRMPGNASLELIQHIQANHPALPVIITTGYPSLETAAVSVRLPVVAYFIKPFDIDAFLETARQEIQNYQVFRLMCKSRKRVESWIEDVRSLEQLLVNRQTQAGDQSLQAYTALTLQGLLASIVDVKSIIETCATRNPSASSETLSKARPLVLIEALRETINVLEHTKSSFKSKELAQLRQKLERLLT